MDPTEKRQVPPGADPERVVVECCAAGTPAVVSFRGGQAGLRAVFSSFRNDQIGLEMTDEPADTVPRGTVCHVSFLHRGRPVNFTAPVRSCEYDADRLYLGVGVPGQIITEGLRSAFRIPASPPPPSVELVGGDGVGWHAELVNLSLTGMLLRFPGEGPTLLPDQTVELSIKISDDPIRLAGVVRRVDEDGVGIFFPDAVSEAPENPVRRAVAALEREWHARLRR